MNADMQTQENQNRARRNRIITGLAFIALGGIWLFNELTGFGDFGQLVLPALALIFIVWGIATRQAGLLIPGGILAGIGTGVILMGSLNLEDLAEPSVFLLSLAGGFGLITVLSALFTDSDQRWALWPAGIIALIGVALMVGGLALDVLELVGRFWPVVLIAIGLWIIFRRERGE